MIDSFGKPTSGILQGFKWNYYRYNGLFNLYHQLLWKGSTSWLGEFGECRNITFQEFKGKYCTLAKPPSPDPTAVVNYHLFYFFSTISVIFNFIKQLRYGICMPNRCNDNDIAQIVNFGNHFVDITIYFISNLKTIFLISNFEPSR